MRGHGNPVVMRLVGERNALLEFYQETHHRIAFRALAELGLAVAYGRAMHLVDSVTWGKRGRDFEAECLELLQAAGLEAVSP